MGLFAKHDENTRITYGYTFQMTKDHFTEEQMEAMKFTYDELAENALLRLNEICPTDVSAAARNLSRAAGGVAKGQEKATERDTYTLLRDNHEKDEALNKLWKQITEVPDWVDWKQIERGQEVLWRYAAPAMVGFAFQGLLGGTGASFRPAETLVRTGGHSVKVARHRFFETFQHLLQVTSSLHSIKPGGEGFKATVRVRFLHAAVRERIMKLVRQRPSYYDVRTYGIPVNDLDNVQALCTFSTNILFLGLPRQGIRPRQQEIVDYIALWKWVGYVIGTPIDQMENPIKAKAAMESLLVNARKPSESSRILAHNIVKSLTNMPPSYASQGYWEVGTRLINSNELADDMGIGRPSLYYWIVILGQSWLFASLCYLCRDIGYLDRTMISFLRKLFWNYVVSGKEGLGGETLFDFKYLPGLEARTQRESDGHQYKKRIGLEALGLVSFVIACSIFLMIGFLGFKSVGALANYTPVQEIVDRMIL